MPRSGGGFGAPFFEHILHGNAVSFRGVVHKNVCDCTNDLSVLQNGRAAHPLHDAAGHGEQIAVRDRERELPAVAGAGNARDHRLVRACAAGSYGGEDRRPAETDLALRGDRYGRERAKRYAACAENTAVRVLFDRADR